MKTPIHQLALIASLVWTAGLCGCATPVAPSPTSPVIDNRSDQEDAAASTSSEAQEAPAGPGIGTIVRVNETDRYVIVNCRRLPSQGEEAKVIRNEWQAGTIRFAGPSHRPFASADIVTGQPEVGDLVLP